MSQMLGTLVRNPTVKSAGDEELPYIALEHVQAHAGRLVADVQLRTDPRDDAVLCTTGDVLFGKLRPYLAKVCRPAEDSMCSSELLVLRPSTNELEPSFLYYVCQSKPFLAWAEATSNGVKMPRTDWSSLRQFRVVVPTHTTQREVARRLDRELKRVDALIAELIAQNTLLWERRRTLVHDAVTGGSLSEDRKPGPPWASSVPARWEIRKVTTLARLGSGHTPSRNRPELWANPTVPWITTGEVQQVRSDVNLEITDTREMLDERGIEESSAVVHPARTVVLCRTAASAGYSGLMGRDMATSQDFATWTCGRHLDPYFLLHCLRAMRPDLLGRLAMGSTHKTIYMPAIRSILIPVPPLDEQLRIVRSLNAQLELVDRVIAESANQVTLLQEQRLAEITAAVAQVVDP